MYANICNTLIFCYPYILFEYLFNFYLIFNAIIVSYSFENSYKLYDYFLIYTPGDNYFYLSNIYILLCKHFIFCIPLFLKYLHCVNDSHYIYAIFLSTSIYSTLKNSIFIIYLLLKE